MANGNRPRDAYYEEINKRAASYDPLNAAFPGRTIEEIASYNERVKAATQDRKFTEPVRRETGLPLGLGLMTVPASVAHTLVKPVVELARQWPKQIELAKRGVYDLGYWAEVAMYGMGGSAPGMRGSQATASGIMLRGEKKVPLLPPGKPAPMFYSQLEKELMSGKYGKNPKAGSLMNRLSKEGVTADELEWTGVGAWLKEQGQQRVEIEDVLRKAQERPLTEQVKFKDLGAAVGHKEQEQLTRNLALIEQKLQDANLRNNILVDIFDRRGSLTSQESTKHTQIFKEISKLQKERYEVSRKLKQLEGVQTQYGPLHPTWGPHWNLPGTIEEGSYRELLVKFPGEQVAKRKMDFRTIEDIPKDVLSNLYHRPTSETGLTDVSHAALGDYMSASSRGEVRAISPSSDWRGAEKEIIRVAENFMDNAEAASTKFLSGHYERGGEGKNLMGWVRGHVRKAYISAKEGWKRVWFIDETQFDWQKKGAKLGYRDEAKIADARASVKLLEGRGYERQIEHIDYIRWPPERRAEWNTQQQNLTERLETARDTLHKLSGADITDVPFKKDWYKLAIRRAMREAAEQDVDGVSWTTAVTQAQRTNRFASAMEWFKSDKGNYEVTFTAPNGEKIVRRYYDLDEVTKEAGQNVTRLIKTQEQEWVAKHGTQKTVREGKYTWNELKDVGYTIGTDPLEGWAVIDGEGARVAVGATQREAISRARELEGDIDFSMANRPHGNASGDFLVKAQFYEMLYDKQFVKFMREEFGALPEKVKTMTGKAPEELALNADALQVVPTGEIDFPFGVVDENLITLARFDDMNQARQFIRANIDRQRKQTTKPGSVDVWYIPLTQELKSRILYEGQRISQLNALDRLKSAYG